MKIKTKIKENFQKDGYRGIVKKAPEYILEISRPLRRNIYGKIIQLKGDQINYKGVEIDLSNEEIKSKLKGRFYLDEYETAEIELIESKLPRDKPVIELGGCIGVTSCKINEKLDNPQEHIVLEANPSLIPSLRRNKKLNNSDFEIKNLAYHPYKENLSFNIHEKFFGGSVQRETDKKIDIDSVSIKEILEQKGWNEAVLICDIEGGEIGLLEKENEIIENRISAAIIEYHPFIDDSFHEKISNLDREIITDRENVVFL